YKKVLDTILLDKLKLDGELELEEVEANEEMIREYKAIKEKEDPGVFVLPIRLEGRVDTHALADTGSNINIIPYRIFEELGREHVKLVSHNVLPR
ncbi:MDIS1-interacting receptor like kinase 2-like protein, partial [Tanacetum coccineum]